MSQHYAPRDLSHLALRHTLLGLTSALATGRAKEPEEEHVCDLQQEEDVSLSSAPQSELLAQNTKSLDLSVTFICALLGLAIMYHTVR